MSHKTLKVLFFTNIPVKNEKRSIGGATVLSENILQFLRKDRDLEIRQIQIRKYWTPKFQAIDFLKWVFLFPFKIMNMDVVSIHATKDMHFGISPILCIWCRLLKKKTIYHFFAGNFHTQYENRSRISKYILRKTILSVNTIFFETKEMVSYFEKRGILNSIWLPNSRKPMENMRLERNYQKKFVFISRIVPNKGVEEIIKAAEILPGGYIVDLYGPLNDSYYNESFFDNRRASYKGALTPEQVESTLKLYDVFLQPTYAIGEGYPGAIIEALGAGLPVISTNWKSIPEIITHGYNGILIDIQNEKQLTNAITFFTEENYQEYRKNAIDSFEASFNSNKVFKQFIKSYKDE